MSKKEGELVWVRRRSEGKLGIEKISLRKKGASKTNVYSAAMLLFNLLFKNIFNKSNNFGKVIAASLTLTRCAFVRVFVNVA